MNRLDHAKTSATEVAHTRYSDARAVLLSGSVLKGNDTPASDLDIVVIYDKLPNAKRESFVSNGWPIEAFVHDTETIRFFCEEFDLKSFTPVLPTMLIESVCVMGDESVANELRIYADKLISNGPKILSIEEHSNFRYAITDIINDIRYPKEPAELQASGISLYNQVANYFLRSRKLWCAHGKAIPRKLKEADPGWALEFVSSFNQLFSGDPNRAIRLAEDLLSPFGGLLFEGYSLDAPAHFRKTE